jgi:hypothetical protein
VLVLHQAVWQAQRTPVAVLVLHQAARQAQRTPVAVLVLHQAVWQAQRTPVAVLVLHQAARRMPVAARRAVPVSRQVAAQQAQTVLPSARCCRV